ncbi:MAG: hypothetical protein GY862_14295 [Gammaproteobacteria bacterium]|nr:hypothetical protein [Gammaproteobacteria bacterium]
MKILLKSLLAGAMLTPLAYAGESGAGEESPVSISGNVAMATDYAFRGVSQTGEEPAIQGGFDIAHQNGLYAGTWASNIKFEAGDDAQIEIDYYLGFSNELSGGFGYDVGYIYYAYPGSDSDRNYGFGEAAVGLSYKFFSLGYNYSNEFFGDTGKAHYIKAGLEFELSRGFGISGHVARQELDEGDDYTDWGLTLSKSLAGLDFSLAYTDTDLDDSDIADARATFSISKNF